MAGNRTHGETVGHAKDRKISKIYRCWQSIKARCLNVRCSCYHRYGGRGITIAEEWKHNFAAFKAWAISAGWKEDLTIERIDVNKGYSPENCTWIPFSEQSRNKEKTIWLTIKGEKMTVREAAKKYGILQNTLYHRIKLIGLDETSRRLENMLNYNRSA